MCVCEYAWAQMNTVFLMLQCSLCVCCLCFRILRRNVFGVSGAESAVRASGDCVLAAVLQRLSGRAAGELCSGSVLVQTRLGESPHLQGAPHSRSAAVQLESRGLLHQHRVPPHR